MQSVARLHLRRFDVQSTSEREYTTLLDDGEIMILLKTKVIDKNKETIVKEWIKKNPKEYKTLIEECKKQVLNEMKDVYMVDIISTLVWYKNISARRSMADALSLLMSKDYPQYFVEDKTELSNTSDISLSQFLSFARENNLRIAV